VGKILVEQLQNKLATNAPSQNANQAFFLIKKLGFSLFGSKFDENNYVFVFALGEPTIIQFHW
jgi:hypothetical protein